MASPRRCAVLVEWLVWIVLLCSLWSVLVWAAVGDWRLRQDWQWVLTCVHLILSGLFALLMTTMIFLECCQQCCCPRKLSLSYTQLDVLDEKESLELVLDEEDHSPDSAKPEEEKAKSTLDAATTKGTRWIYRPVHQPIWLAIVSLLLLASCSFLILNVAVIAKLDFQRLHILSALNICIASRLTLRFWHFLSRE